MPTAVLDLDLEQWPASLPIAGHYERALALIRYAGQPVGQALLPVTGGQADAAMLSRARAVVVGTESAGPGKDLDQVQSTAGTRTLPGATVVVCTRDRPQQLQNCLEALVRLHDDGQDILVVDNSAASGAARSLVGRFHGIGYVHEPRPGLSIARNRAMRETHHPVVVFADDDTVPDRGWLRGLLRNFDDSSVLCVTGLTMPLELETEPQEWFERYSPFGRGFRRVVFDRCSLTPLAAAMVGSGNNMALRRSVIELVGPFDELLGAGTPTCAGEETDMFARILAAGYRIVYDPGALNWHHHRATRRRARKQLYGYGVGMYAFWTRHFLFEGRTGAPKAALGWFGRYQLPALVRSFLRRQDAVPPDLVLAQLWGCLVGPWIYLSSRRRVRVRR